MNFTQLSSFETFDPSNIIFSQPENGSISNSIPKISFKRIRVNTTNPDGTVGDLILSTPEQLLSFGLQENRDMSTQLVNGYSFPLCLWNKLGATPSEKIFIEKFNGMVERCKSHLLQNRDEIEKYDLEMNDLKKLNPLFWKMDRGKIVEGKGPMLYAKVMLNKKNDQILTTFIDDETSEEIPPMDLLNKKCYVTAALKVESIFIGTKISLQVKLYEAVVRVIDTSRRTLLRSVIPKAAPPTVTASTGEYTQSTIYSHLVEEEEEEEDDNFSLEGDEVTKEEVVEEEIAVAAVEEVIPTVPVVTVEEEDESGFEPVKKKKSTTSKKTKK